MEALQPQKHTAFFLLAVRFVADREPGPGPSRAVQGLRLAFAAAAGVAVAALVVATHHAPAKTRLADSYFEASPALGKGLNLVNFVLADARALDTLVETFVVLLAGLGAVALLREREVPRPASAPPASAPSASARKEGP